MDDRPARLPSKLSPTPRPPTSAGPPPAGGGQPPLDRRTVLKLGAAAVAGLGGLIEPPASGAQAPGEPPVVGCVFTVD